MGNKRKQGHDNKSEEGFAKAPSELYAQMLSCRSNDSAPSVIISTDKERWSSVSMCWYTKLFEMCCIFSLPMSRC